MEKDAQKIIGTVNISGKWLVFEIDIGLRILLKHVERCSS